MLDKPQEIVDEEHEQVCERVAAIDVAKATGMVCVRVRMMPGRAGGSAGSGRCSYDPCGDRAGGSPGLRGDREGHPRVDERLRAK